MTNARQLQIIGCRFNREGLVVQVWLSELEEDDAGVLNGVRIHPSRLLARPRLLGAMTEADRAEAVLMAKRSAPIE